MAGIMFTRGWWVWFPVALMCALVPSAWASDAAQRSHIDFTVDTAYRVDSLDWNIANDASGLSTPNVASELRWRSLKIYQTRLNIDAEDRQVVFRGSIAYGRIASGSNEDSDYAGNNRTQEWSRSANDAGAGNTTDLSLGLGYRLAWPESTSGLSVVPLAGFAWHRQKLRMRNSTQVVSQTATVNGTVVTAQPLGPLAGLDSRYTSMWRGPWLGADVDWQSGVWSAMFSGRYEWVYYRGEADWNLRTDFQHPISFRHTARGYGWRIGVKTDYLIAPKWSLGVQGDISRFITRAGTDTAFFAAGGIGVTRFNKVTWSSASLGLHAVYHY